MCVSINSPGDLDLLLFDLEPGCESRQRWGTFVPNLGTLGLRVLQLFAMYATAGGQKQSLLPLPTGGGINRIISLIIIIMNVTGF